MVGSGRKASGLMHVIVPPGTLVEGASIALNDEEAHHLSVRRVGEGTALRAIDGAGVLAMGHALKVSRQAARIDG